MARLKLDLNKDVNINLKSRGNLPTKTSINLVPKKETIMSTREGRIKVIGGAILALVLIGLLIVRPLIGLIGANAKASQLQKELDQANKQIAQMSDIEEEYAHYTEEDMTAEELGRVDRVQIMNLVQKSLISGGVAKKWSISGNVMALEITGGNLAQLNQIAGALEQEPIVERCVINAANKGSSADNSNVDATFVIYLTQNDTSQDEFSHVTGSDSSDTGEEENNAQ